MIIKDDTVNKYIGKWAVKKHNSRIYYYYFLDKWNPMALKAIDHLTGEFTKISVVKIYEKYSDKELDFDIIEDLKFIDASDVPDKSKKTILRDILDTNMITNFKD